MKNLSDLIATFANGIAHSRAALIGALIVTSIFPFLLGAVLYDIIWDMRNTYFAALSYLVLGPMVLIGLSLIFVGLFFFRGKEDVRLFTLTYLRDYFTNPDRFYRMRKLLFVFVFISCTMFCIFGIVTYRSYTYMNTTSFCATFCHMVMEPQRVAHSNSPHSQVSCVQCHLGGNAKWFEKAKISGLQQVVSVLGHSYSRPIKTPIHHLRPDRSVCEECHRPGQFHGDKLEVMERFRPDEQNTSVKTVILLKVGSAGDRSFSPHGYHWDVAPENRMLITTTGPDEREIVMVKFKESTDPEKVFMVKDADKLIAKNSEQVITREMDCIDCHNRPTHNYLSASQAIDMKLLNGEIPREIPFIKRQALEVVNEPYFSQQEAMVKIAAGLRSWYRQNRPEIDVNDDLLCQAIIGTQNAYRENVFPAMKVGWDTYIDHIGHGEEFDRGCFRCHDGKHLNSKGEAISNDCNTCHVILAKDDPNPEILQKIEGR